MIATLGKDHTMKTSVQIQEAIHTLTAAFAPLNCVIQAARKDSFSFTLVDEHGIACHSERLYPQQYQADEPLRAVIQRVQSSLAA
ncbi:MAG: hypothetical protein GAK36_00228 [Pseudomonas sp.]|nr:MAG: hypothetical protein GAK36_00228 [Pseudomonas sp.]